MLAMGFMTDVVS